MNSKVISRKATKTELKTAFKAQPEAIQKHDTTYRSIAKMLSSAIQIEGEFEGHVNEFLQQINKLPREQRIALKYAYIFSRKAPKEERADLMQELSLTLLTKRVKDEKLAYAIARCDWKDFWKAFKLHSQYNLDSIERMADAEDGGNYGQDAIDRMAYHSELLMGEIECEARIDARLLYNKLPKHIQSIVNKRLSGYATSKLEQSIMRRWIASRPNILTEYSTYVNYA
ncbi:MAG: hypothetical protein PHO67_07950 [Candidatus Omnitrophica bacterium]|nr:hypothetical protein [Candidatus Omnitrophota bacterium]